MLKAQRVESRILNYSTIILISFVLCPIAAVIILSFTSGTTISFPPPGWSLRWYAMAYHTLANDLPASTGAEFSSAGRFAEALGTSFVIAAATVFVVTLISVPAAYALARYRFPGRTLVDQLVSLPTVYPLIVLGIGLLVFASRLRVEFGFGRIVIAHVIITLPFVVRNCTASLAGISPSLEEAAKTLGASAWRAFLKVVLPLMRPGIMAGVLLAFILSFNEFTLAYFLYTPDILPFPIWLFTQSDKSFNPMILSLSTGAVLLDVFLLILLERVAGGDGTTI